MPHKSFDAFMTGQPAAERLQHTLQLPEKAQTANILLKLRLETSKC
jgi:hypothetical protein